MARKPAIFGNWKMNPAPDGWDTRDSPYRPREEIDIAVFPIALELAACIERDLLTGIQCARPEEVGAFTGDISLRMAKDLGCTHALSGHSDRRLFHGETDAFVAEQAKAALALGLIPVICIGETRAERDKGDAKQTIERQMKLLPLDRRIILAYEPVWAISRGDLTVKPATTEEAQEMHAFIRSLLPKNLQDDIRILYGGSMNSKNAEELLAQADIDGGLIGSASLKPEEFRLIVEAAVG